MTYEYFTAKEITEAIQELGFQAKFYDDKDCPRIESSSSGTKWTTGLCGIDPFFDSIFLHTIIWVQDNPFQWANNWNSYHRSSMAQVLMPDDDSNPIPDEEGDYMIMVNFSYDFEGGVSTQYLQRAFTQWLSQIEELAELDDIKMCTPQSFRSS